MISALSREHPLTPLALAVASSLPVSVASAASATSVPPAKASSVGAKAMTMSKLPVVDSLTPAAPSGATARFSHRVGKQDVAFALDVKANRLSWQVPPVASQAGQVSTDAKPAAAAAKATTVAAAAAGQWNTVALLKTQTAALKAWLEKPTSASANASTSAGMAKKEGTTVPTVAVSGKP